MPWLGPKILKRRAERVVVPVIRLAGVIADSGGFGRPTLSLSRLAGAMDKAFETKGARAVALAINSPGGSPAQSILIASRIRLLAKEKKLPVYAFCEDAAASGGYWLACAADEIYATPASVVGSIGVISAGFGFTDLIKKIGVERRVYAAGENKSQLDPFQPEDKEDIARLKDLQADIHAQFKEWVTERRGDKLVAATEAEEDLFSGRFWTGRRAKELGLIDEIGDVRSVCRAKFGDKVRLPVVTPARGWLQRRLGLDARGSFVGAGSGLVEAALGEAERRAWWARLGL
ncbi:MAG: S49 family peptidase [Alphaproteobacteria bacterium]|nr:S49 family peptidase [Alphaproteobacteria bacterium]